MKTKKIFCYLLVFCGILFIIFSLGIIIDKGLSKDGELQWVDGGSPVVTESYDQVFVRGVPDGKGNVFLSWYDQKDKGTLHDVYIQKVDINGKQKWANPVPVCNAEGLQQHPMPVTDGKGGVILVWQDRRNGDWDIYAQRMDGKGNPLWKINGIPVCDAAKDQKIGGLVIPDGNGGAIFAWMDNRGGTGYDIYAQRIDANGKSLWTNNGVPVCTYSGNQYWPSIIPDGKGGAILAWEDNRGVNGYDIYAQGIDAYGNNTWIKDGVVVCDAVGDQSRVRGVSDKNGGAIFCWEDKQNGSEKNLYAQHIDASGITSWQKNGVEVAKVMGNKIYPSMVEDTKGGVIISWANKDNGNNYDICAQRIDKKGNISWGTMGVVICDSLYDQNFPFMVSDNEGGAIVCWSDYRNGSDWDQYAQRVDRDGSTGWQYNGIPICSVKGDQMFGWPVLDGYNGVVIPFLDKRNGYDYDIYIQRVGLKKDTDPLLSVDNKFVYVDYIKHKNGDIVFIIKNLNKKVEKVTIYSTLLMDKIVKSLISGKIFANPSHGSITCLLDAGASDMLLVYTKTSNQAVTATATSSKGSQGSSSSGDIIKTEQKVSSNKNSANQGTVSLSPQTGSKSVSITPAGSSTQKASASGIVILVEAEKLDEGKENLMKVVGAKGAPSYKSKKNKRIFMDTWEEMQVAAEMNESRNQIETEIENSTEREIPGQQHTKIAEERNNKETDTIKDMQKGGIKGFTGRNTDLINFFNKIIAGLKEWWDGVVKKIRFI